MAEGEGIERAPGRVVDVLDHPILFLLAVTMGVVAFSAFLYWGFLKLGWTGPASLFH